MKRLVLAFGVAAAMPVNAIDFGNLLPKRVEDIIPALTGGGLAVACNQALRGRDGQAVATLVCGSLGVLVGQHIKAALKEREQVQLAEATNTTLSTGKAQTVRTAEGSTLTTELVVPPAANPAPPASPASRPPTRAERKAEARGAQSATSPPAVAQTPVQGAVAAAVVAEGTCGTVKQTVVTLDNQRLEDTVTACKKGDTWVAA